MAWKKYSYSSSKNFTFGIPLITWSHSKKWLKQKLKVRVLAVSIAVEAAASLIKE